MDRKVTLEDAKRRVRAFCEERDWDQFHGPKDLAIGVVTEAAELLELFRFLDDEQARHVLARPRKRLQVENELADVLFFVLRFAQRFGIDLDDALLAKLALNDERYPVELARGTNLRSDEL